MIKMENDKIFIWFIEKYGDEYREQGSEARAFGFVIGTDYMLETIDKKFDSNIGRYLFNKYGFEFIKHLKKLLKSKK